MRCACHPEDAGLPAASSMGASLCCAKAGWCASSDGCCAASSPVQSPDPCIDRPTVAPATTLLKLSNTCAHHLSDPCQRVKQKTLAQPDRPSAHAAAASHVGDERADHPLRGDGHCAHILAAWGDSHRDELLAALHQRQHPDGVSVLLVSAALLCAAPSGWVFQA